MIKVIIINITKKSRVDISEISSGVYSTGVTIVWSDEYTQNINSILFLNTMPKPEIRVNRVMEEPWQHWPWEEPRELYREVALVIDDNVVGYHMLKLDNDYFKA